MKRYLIFITSLFLACQLSATAQVNGKKTLDKRDLIISEWNTEVATNVKFLDHETIYNAAGQKIQETEYSKLGKVWTKKFEYSSDGKVSRELTYNNKGKLDNIQKFEYNEYGKKKAVYTYDAKGKLIKTKILEYKFRDHSGK